MPRERIRILSDIHYGDRASRVLRLAQLRPLFDGATRLVLNGDTLDTRPGPAPAHTAACRAEVLEFFPREAADTLFLTGNHDADVSPHHLLDLAGGEVFVVHGDIFYEDIVPWSRDAPLIARLIAEELRKLPPGHHGRLDERLALFRRVAAVIPQRHQSEKRGLRYLARYLADTAWPPQRVIEILRAWRHLPMRADRLVREHRPAARFVLAGHTHRPGIWTTPGGIIVINTGAFCLPFGGCVVDVEEERLTVRRVEARQGEFRLGEKLREFPLARR